MIEQGDGAGRERPHWHQVIRETDGECLDPQWWSEWSLCYQSDTWREATCNKTLWTVNCELPLGPVSGVCSEMVEFECTGAVAAFRVSSEAFCLLASRGGFAFHIMRFIWSLTLRRTARCCLQDGRGVSIVFVGGCVFQTRMTHYGYYVIMVVIWWWLLLYGYTYFSWWGA